MRGGEMAECEQLEECGGDQVKARPAVGRKVDPGVLADHAATSRSTDQLDSYRRTTESLRDTTKWLLTVVPVAGSIVAVGTLVPRLAEFKAADASRTVVLVWLLVGAACVALTVALAARVLTTTPVGWGDVVRMVEGDRAVRRSPGGPSYTQFQAEADRHGVLRLYGYRSTSELLASIALDDLEKGPTFVPAGNTLVDFATFRIVRRRFRWFIGVGGGAAVTASACVLVALFNISRQDISLDAPTSVELVPTLQGRRALVEAGCDPTDGRVDGVAISGTWVEPDVVVSDGECDPTYITWRSAWGPVIPER